MNIFVTSQCPIACAKFLDDKRVIKMVLETAQLLSTAIQLRGTYNPRLYKKTHEKHPCTLWVAESMENYSWTLQHFQALCTEYYNRYGRTHKSESLLQIFQGYQYLVTGKYPSLFGADTLPVPKTFVNCARNKELGIDYTDQDNVFFAYIMYLRERWARDKRPPTWFQERRATKQDYNTERKAV